MAKSQIRFMMRSLLTQRLPRHDPPAPGNRGNIPLPRRRVQQIHVGLKLDCESLIFGFGRHDALWKVRKKLFFWAFCGFSRGSAL
jgi:hypothetical protein